LLSTNKLQGIVFDLRFTRGGDFSAAAGVADLFASKERPLLDWGKGLQRSTAKSDAFLLPIAVLVNHQTAEAAEALAAVLRDSGAAVVLGNRTAGQAMIAQEFTLKDGQRLRIATAPIKLGSGGTLSAEGVKPDISVSVGPQEEREYMADPFKSPQSPNALFANANLSLTNQPGTTNRARRSRFNEAELVRERREGASLDGELSLARGNEPEKPVVRDPVLARGMDILKGLAVVRQSRS
jgi:C-terminal processing protease CtpA/Prc